jgi:hypothetical protein
LFAKHRPDMQRWSFRQQVGSYRNHLVYTIFDALAGVIAAPTRRTINRHSCTASVHFDLIWHDFLSLAFPLSFLSIPLFTPSLDY